MNAVFVLTQTFPDGSVRHYERDAQRMAEVLLRAPEYIADRQRRRGLRRLERQRWVMFVAGIFWAMFIEAVAQQVLRWLL